MSAASLITSIRPRSLSNSFDMRDTPPSKPGCPTDTSSSVGTKRKRTNLPKFYAVRLGHRPGVYFSWEDCLPQITGYKNATFKSFSSIADAESFLAGNDPTEDPSSASFGQQKFYAVHVGRTPGVYTKWTSAQEQIKGWAKPKYRSFLTRAEAEAFVRDGGDGLVESHEDESAAVAVAPKKGRPASAVAASTDHGPPAKKAKRSTKAATAAADETSPRIVEPGTGPLPPGTEDDFDPRITLNPQTGQVEWKTNASRQPRMKQVTDSKSDRVLRIYTDGSALGNGQGGAVGGIGIYFGDGDPRNLSEPLTGSRQTNNRAELTAILRALDLAPRNVEVCIFTDSEYSIKCLTVWFQAWRRNNWVASNGRSVENRDLIEAILSRIEERLAAAAKTNFQWLRGHANHHGNVQADHLAVLGAQRARS